MEHYTLERSKERLGERNLMRRDKKTAKPKTCVPVNNVKECQRKDSNLRSCDYKSPAQTG